MIKIVVKYYYFVNTRYLNKTAEATSIIKPHRAASLLFQPDGVTFQIK